jgi:hypothetical protein
MIVRFVAEALAGPALLFVIALARLTATTAASAALRAVSKPIRFHLPDISTLPSQGSQRDPRFEVSVGT